MEEFPEKSPQQAFADGGVLAMEMMKNKSMMFLPWMSITSFFDRVADGDPLALEHVKDFYNGVEGWPLDKS